MKIWIDCSFGLNKKTGIGAYILALCNALDNLEMNYQKISCMFSERAKIKFKAIFYLIELNTFFFIKTLIQKPDMIIFPAFAMPLLKRKKTKYFTVIYDLSPLSFPETMGSYARFIYSLYIKIAIKKADKIVAISETVKNELIKEFNILPERIHIISCMLSEQYTMPVCNNFDIEKYNLKSQKYILSVATLNKRKNLQSLIKAFECISDKISEIKLVLVGTYINDDIKISSKNIIMTGYLSDEEVLCLYQNALMYVFPSIYEGFGIPIIEAQSTNVPVVCSDIPVFREVAGDAALFCEPKPEKIAEKIEELINDEQLRKELIQKGQINIKRFDIDVITKQLSNLLQVVEH